MTKLNVLAKAALFSLFATSTTSMAATSSIKNQVDDIFSDIKSNEPGCSVGVIQNGKLVHQAGYGLANLELGVPLDGTHVHRIASVSKQFTGLAVLLLADEGKIKLSDDIRQHLPQLRDYGTKVTINAMLGHFSGMGDYDFVTELDDKSAMKLRSAAGGNFRLGLQDYLTIEEFYDYVKTVPLRRNPNEQWEYSNYAYFLLSMLVEEVSGETLRAYADKRIFKPLNMTNTFFSDKETEIVPNRASGYAKTKKGHFENSMTNLFWVGDGGLHTNVTDLAKWDAYFYNPTLGKNPKALLKQFNTPNSHFTTEGSVYANGQSIKEEDGVTTFSHGGGWMGVSTYYARVPDKQVSSIVLCNDQTNSAFKYSQAILKTLL